MAQVKLGKEFFNQVDSIPSDEAKIRFYYTVLCVVGAVNYPDVVPEIWNDAWERMLKGKTHDQQFKAAQKFREALIKACGIMGPAKTGTTMRTLGKCIPKELRDGEARRSKETEEQARERGYALHQRIYGRNPEFDMDATPTASPDYTFVMRDLLYVRHHMKGMLYNGATREELLAQRDPFLNVAHRLDVKFRGDPQPIPTIDDKR